jgi:hypothetical protein
MAHAKAAELRMEGYKDVILSIASVNDNARQVTEAQPELGPRNPTKSRDATGSAIGVAVGQSATRERATIRHPSE